MGDWLDRVPALAGLEASARANLSRLIPMTLPAGATLFHPGDSVRGYAIVLSGRVNVSLTGATGREILLYSVEPGQSCIQSTMGLLGGADYTAEAVVQRDTTLVLLPKAVFLDLINTSSGFRTIVFRAFADRMQDMMQLFEKVSFQRVECRLAEHLLAQAEDPLHTTHAELATHLGSAREVVSRRLEAWARRGLVKTGRGTIEILDRIGLSEIARSTM
ncbi:MAG: Crp/Fnr family transcriptional regulator [Rhodobacterales bacterium]|nr:MAG: Crp/Fnr family transcriptional regulator [Rhodobacterales bacterium]